jgi:hypothetical protein
MLRPGIQTLHLQVVRLGYIQQIVALRNGNLMLGTLFVDEGDPESVFRLAGREEKAIEKYTPPLA